MIVTQCNSFDAGLLTVVIMLNKVFVVFVCTAFIITGIPKKRKAVFTTRI